MRKKIVPLFKTNDKTIQEVDNLGHIIPNMCTLQGHVAAVQTTLYARGNAIEKIHVFHRNEHSCCPMVELHSSK